MPYNDWEWGLGNIQKFLLWDVQKFGPAFAVSSRQVIFRIKVVKLWSEPLAKDRRPSSYLNSGYFQQFWRATAGHFHIVRNLQRGLWNQSSLIFLPPPPNRLIVFLPQVPDCSSFSISKSVCHIPIAMTYFFPQ